MVVVGAVVVVGATVVGAAVVGAAVVGAAVVGAAAVGAVVRAAELGRTVEAVVDDGAVVAGAVVGEAAVRAAPAWAATSVRTTTPTREPPASTAVTLRARFRDGPRRSTGSGRGDDIITAQDAPDETWGVVVDEVGELYELEPEDELEPDDEPEPDDDPEADELGAVVLDEDELVDADLEVVDLAAAVETVALLLL